MTLLATRPTTLWREGVDEEARLVASVELEEEFAVSATLYPPDLLARMDEVLAGFEREVGGLTSASDDEVLATIRRVVLALNTLNDEYDKGAIETAERDLLCAYIDETVAQAGVDLDALSARQAIERVDLTDEWRTW
jgi:hypothetical protein